MSKRLTPKATTLNANYDAWMAQGWTDAQLEAEGYLEITPDAQPLPSVAEAERAFETAQSNSIRVNQYSTSAEEKAAASAASKAALEVLNATRAKIRNESDAERAPPSLIGSSQQLEVFKGCRYVEDLHAILVPGEVDALDQKRFDVRYSGVYLLDIQKSTDKAWEVFTASRFYKFPRVGATYFDPRDPPGHIRTDEQGKTAVNTFVPPKLERAAGDATPFIGHIRKILPNGNDANILLSYLAACIQHPGVKAPWAPLLQGVEGNGKSLIVDVMARAIGRRYTHAARASEIDGRFNSYLYGKLFVAFNEVKVSQDKASVWETLKSYITDVWQQIEYKGGAIVQRELLFNMLFATNHTDALPKTKDARRICPLFCAQQSEADLRRDGMLDANGQTSEYFDGLFHWLEHQGGYGVSAGYLATYPIPDELNFAKRCKRAPLTTSTEAAIGASMGLVEQEVAEAVESGADGFRGGWIASHRLHWLMDQSQRGRAIARNKRSEVIKAMGYVLHPGLPDGGRAPVPLPDGQRPRLFVTANHPSVGLRGVEVASAYLEAQKMTATDAAPIPTPQSVAPSPTPDAQLQQQAQLGSVLERLGWPTVATLPQVMDADFSVGWLVRPQYAHGVPGMFAALGYVAVKNPNSDDGLWALRQRFGRHPMYGRSDRSEAEHMAAAVALGAG